ncbi:uncharacterized protein LOC128961201, partial [Oppia nitens]|uniref:uncharacterized protein LOC128961201 n=1 Tax=Oppia nitens TaxID=1686743 RepID=UPI0023DBF643
MIELKQLKLFTLNSLLTCFIVILKVYCQLITAEDNDVHFDFNKYFKVNIATNKPIMLETLVTLYNPHAWPGPNDTHTSTPKPTTTSMPFRRQRARFAYGLRRSAAEFRNHGYGYDWNISQPVTYRPIIYENNMNKTYIPNNYDTNFTISPINRKFYDTNYDHIYGANNTFTYRQNYTQDYYNNNNTVKWTTFVPNYSYGYRIVTERPLFSYNVNNTRNFPVYRPKVLVRNEWPTVRNFTLQTIGNQTANSTFRCEYMRYFGYYADINTNCRVFHVCTPDGRKSTFICPYGLLFNQKLTVCDWSRNVDCRQSIQFYDTNNLKFDN